MAPLTAGMHFRDGSPGTACGGAARSVAPLVGDDRDRHHSGHDDAHDDAEEPETAKRTATARRRAWPRGAPSDAGSARCLVASMRIGVLGMVSAAPSAYGQDRELEAARRLESDGSDQLSAWRRPSLPLHATMCGVSELASARPPPRAEDLICEAAIARSDGHSKRRSFAFHSAPTERPRRPRCRRRRQDCWCLVQCSHRPRTEHCLLDPPGEGALAIARTPALRG